jgi:lipopolysaccharide heptosyltransferase I
MIHIFSRTGNREPLDRMDAGRICLIKPSALGDVVQALPVLSALRGRFPDATIAWVVNRSYADLLAGHPHLNEVIPFDRGRARPWSPAAWRSMRDLCESLRERRFDLVCDLQGLFRSGLMTWGTRARRRVGLGDAREGAHLVYSDVVAIPQENMSAVDRYWLVAEALGAGAAAKQFVLPLDAADRDWTDRQLSGLTGLRVAIHAGARWMTKRWPEEHFIEIARRLHREFAADLVLVGGSEEAEAAARIAAAAPGRCENLVGKTTLKQLAAVLDRVHLLFTNDSGPMHLAAALGTRVAAVFTCTSPERARPYGPGHAVFATNVWCAASYLKKCSRMECMTELTPDRVWSNLSALLATLTTELAA